MSKETGEKYPHGHPYRYHYELQLVRDGEIKETCSICRAGHRREVNIGKQARDLTLAWFKSEYPELYREKLEFYKYLLQGASNGNGSTARPDDRGSSS